MDIILIRHGESEANRSHSFGNGQVALSPRGVEQAQKTRPHLDFLRGKKVYVSPYKRALDTMNHLGLQGEVLPDIREMHLGILEGSTFQKLEESHPEDARKWASGDLNYSLPGGGESIVAAYERVAGVMEMLIEKNEDAVLVCHDGVIRQALCYVLGGPEHFFKFYLDNVSLSKIHVEDGFVHLGYVNRIYY